MELMYFSMEKNKNKQKETHSDYSIKMNNNDPNKKYASDFVGGCWIRKNDDGSEWLSCSIDPEKIPPAVMAKCFNGANPLPKENESAAPVSDLIADTNDYSDQVPF